MSSHKGIVWSVMPERRKPTLASVNAHLDKALAAADRTIDRLRDFEASRREAERAAFSRDFTPGPWPDAPAAQRDVVSDYCEMAPSRYDVVADAEPAGDFSPAPADRWETRA